MYEIKNILFIREISPALNLSKRLNKNCSPKRFEIIVVEKCKMSVASKLFIIPRTRITTVRSIFIILFKKFTTYRFHIIKLFNLKIL